jgi:integrase
MSVTVRNNADGSRTWKVRWREDGRARARTFTTAADAKLWDAEVTRRKRLGTLAVLDSGSRTLDEFVTDSWGPDRAQGLASATRTFYAGLYRTHIAAEFGGTRLRDITPPKVAAWRTSRQRAKAGAKALREAHSLLGGILGYAVELGELQFNAARAVRPTRRAKPEPVRAWSPREIEAIRREMTPFDATLVSVLAYAGLRPAEALALRWADLRDTTVLVARACDLDSGGMKTTKTGGHRTVRLLAPLAADLAEWRMRQGRPVATAPLFAAGDGGAWTKTDWQNWRVRRWTPALKAAKLEYAVPYSCRHSFASLLLAEGRSIHYVAGQLGHGAEQTLRTYGHVIAEFADRVDVVADDEIRTARVSTECPRDTEVNTAA